MLVVFFTRRNRTSGWVLFYAAVGFGLGFLGTSGLFKQMHGHREITTLDPGNLRSIKISGQTFADERSMAALTSALKSSRWFIPSHTSYSESGDLEVLTKNGNTIRFHLGHIHGEKRLLIYDDHHAFEDVNEDLLKVLEAIGTNGGTSSKQ
ncbi:MAG TPA: hypothetical protein VI685_02105 [Candidatus Angelobacter sp.]